MPILSKKSVGQISLPFKCSFFNNFVQKGNFVWSQFEQMDAKLSEFWWFALGSRRILGKSCFKVVLNVYFCYFCTKNQLWAITVSEYGCCTQWILFIQIAFIACIRRKLFQSSKSYVAQVFLTLKCSFLRFLYKKLTLRIKVSESGCDTCWIFISVVSVGGSRGK